MFLPDPALMTFAPAVVYGMRLLYLFISMALIALGILLYLAPDLLSLPGEGIMQVMAAKSHQPLPVVKMCFDCTVSIIALILSLVILAAAYPFQRSILSGIFGSIEPEVMANAQTYFGLSLLSYPFLALYNGGAALFRAMGNSRI